MPLWLIFHPPSIFDDLATKQALTKDITKIYTSINLPPFYVVVNFIKLSTEDVWVGGEMRTKKPFVRIVADHIAVRMEDEDHTYKHCCDAFDRALKPHIADKGYDWEFHIDETERRLWRVNGMIPPPFGSDEEKLWAEKNKPMVWDGAY
ncbi:putative oxalocrotonate tautomerase [Aspergillus floccosus]